MTTATVSNQSVETLHDGAGSTTHARSSVLVVEALHDGASSVTHGRASTLVVEVLHSASPVPVSAMDSGGGAEGSPVVTALLAGLDQGTSSEAAALTTFAFPMDSDSGSSTEAYGLLVSVSSADSGYAAENDPEEIFLASTDFGSSTEGAVVTNATPPSAIHMTEVGRVAEIIEPAQMTLGGRVAT